MADMKMSVLLDTGLRARLEDEAQQVTKDRREAGLLPYKGRVSSSMLAAEIIAQSLNYRPLKKSRKK